MLSGDVWRRLGLAGRVFDTKKHSNIKRKAAYRRIQTYTKSLAKHKAEKARRQQVLPFYGWYLASQYTAILVVTAVPFV